MNKLVLDVKIDRDLKENDIIVYKNGWTIVSKKDFLASELVKLKDQNVELEKKIEKLEVNLKKLATIVKEK